MITDLHRKKIADLLQREYSVLGTWQKVATKTDANVATISKNMQEPERWVLVSDAMWAKISGKLGYKITQEEWVMVETTNSKIVSQVLSDAQNDSLYMAISEKDGSGKSSSLAAYKSKDENSSVMLFECREWTRRTFLLKLAESLGLQTSRNELHLVRTNEIFDKIVYALKVMSVSKRPLLVLDEADKLQADALAFIVPLYNQLKGEIGLVIAGTENLEKQILRGVAYAKKGYDEIHSRLGRNFVHLVGTTKADVTAICLANGIPKERVAGIWNELDIEQRTVNGRFIEVVVDLRRLERIVRRERKHLGNAVAKQSLLIGEGAAVLA
jgi:hypothetical protein